ncbi:unnamed protein product [Cochlearia groenlandica]
MAFFSGLTQHRWVVSSRGSISSLSLYPFGRFLLVDNEIFAITFKISVGFDSNNPISDELRGQVRQSRRTQILP